jgi:hypothetical protein
MHATGCIYGILGSWGLPLERSRDTAWQLLIRSREAIARFERANADGNPAELAEARTALESCYAEVKWLVAVKKAMKAEKLEATVRKLTTSATARRAGNGLRLVSEANRRPLDLSLRRGPC